MSPPEQRRFHADRLSRRLLGPIFGAVCLVSTCTGIVVLAILLGSIVVAALQGPPDNPGHALGANIAELVALVRRLASATQDLDPTVAGYRVGIVGSLWLLGLVAVVGIPVGVGAGVYLKEYAPPGRLRRIIQTNIANLAGVPSIVYGILGLALFVRAFGFKAVALGPTLLSGVLTLSLLILPIIVITTQERSGPCRPRCATPPWRLAPVAGRWYATMSCPVHCQAS